MNVGMSMRFEMRHAHKCDVCQQFRDEDRAHATAVEVALFGRSAYAVCACCGQEPPDHRNQAYRRRFRAWRRDQVTP